MPARDRQPHDRRSDEARAACHQDLHADTSNGDCQSANGVAALSLSDSTGSLTPQSMPRLSQRTAPSQSRS